MTRIVLSGRVPATDERQPLVVARVVRRRHRRILVGGHAPLGIDAHELAGQLPEALDEEVLDVDPAALPARPVLVVGSLGRALHVDATLPLRHQRQEVSVHRLRLSEADGAQLRVRAEQLVVERLAAAAPHRRWGSGWRQSIGDRETDSRGRPSAAGSPCVRSRRWPAAAGCDRGGKMACSTRVPGHWRCRWGRSGLWPSPGRCRCRYTRRRAPRCRTPRPGWPFGRSGRGSAACPGRRRSRTTPRRPGPTARRGPDRRASSTPRSPPGSWGRPRCPSLTCSPSGRSRR